MKEPKISVQLLKRIVYGDEKVDPEMERLLNQISGRVSKREKSLSGLVNYSPRSVSDYIKQKYSLGTSPEEVEDFYRQIGEISNKPLSQRKKAEVVVEMLDLAENAQKELLGGKVFLAEALTDAISF